MRTRWTWGFREDAAYTLTRRASGPNVVFEIDGRSRWLPCRARHAGHASEYYLPTWFWVVTPPTWLDTFRGRTFDDKVARAAGQAETFLARLHAEDDEAKRAHEEAKRVAGLFGGVEDV